MNQYIIIFRVKKVLKSDLKDFDENLKNMTTVINRIHKKSLITPLELVDFGEGQCIALDLQSAISILFDIEECLIENGLNYKLKYVIYNYSVDLDNSKYSIFENLGLSLIDARNRLNTIKKTDTRFLVVSKNETLSLNLNNLFLVYEDYVDSWKTKDFEYVKAFLNHLDYKEVSSLFNINTSNGWRKEKKLKLKQYFTIKEMILGSV